MGVTNGGKAMYRIKDLTRAEFTSIVRGLAKAEKMQHATIVVDVSNLMFGVSSKVKAVAEYLFEMAGSGLTIRPVCDNNIRPSVKQATNKRRAQREKARSEEIVLRREVRVLKRRLHQESLTEQERSDLLEEIVQLEKKRRRKETASNAPTQTNFNDELERELDLLSAKSINDAGGSVLKVVTAECQADLYMARQIQIKEAVMVLSTDADIPTLTGDCCISINGFSQTKIELVSTSKVTLENAMSHVIRDKGSKAKLVDAEQPIFENVVDNRLRAMMMLICGCDVYCPGLKGTGIATVSKHINTFKETSDDPQNETKLFEYLLEIMKKEFKPRMKEQNHEESADEEARKVVLTYIDALVFEPTNAINEERTYLVNAPKELSQYCKDFAASDTKIIPGPTILECKGVGGKAHPFLAADGHGTCAKCNHTVCSYCQGTLGMDTSAYCLLCAATESLVPTLGTEAPEDSVQAKRTKLLEDGFAGAKDLDSDEVEDVFEALEFMNRYRNESMDKDNVPFPLYASNAMDDEENSAWEDIAEINFSQGGSFIADGSINEKLIPRVLKFFAGVTTFASPDEKHTDWKKDAAIYDALPKLLIDFAGKSRADSGYRLLKRCVRHALDSKCPSLEDKTATLILHGEDIGLRIHSDIPASMRKGVVYKPGVAFTETDVLCCQCTCHCGSQDDERVVCVHNFPLIFLLLLLLMDALAENILLELAACMRSNIWDTAAWSDDEVKSMKQYVVTLAEAAGEDMASINLEKTSIVDLLEKFETGTQGRKEWKQRCKSKPKPGDHCAIVDVGKFESTATEAKKRTSRPSQKNSQHMHSLGRTETTDDPAITEDAVPHEPNYVDMELLIEASGCVEVLQSNPIAWQLIKIRSRKQRERLEINNSEIISKSKELTKEWEKAARLTRKRTHRTSDEQIVNLQKRQRIDPSAASRQIQLRVVTPTDELLADEVSQTAPSAVTPSPKKRIRRPGCDLPSRTVPPQKQKPRKKRISIKCCKRGCNNNRRDNLAVKFHLVTSPRKPLNSSKPKKPALINQAGAKLLRQEIMDRVFGTSMRNDVKKKCYICDEHDFEEVSKSTSVKLGGGKSINVTYKLVVPVGAGPMSTLSHPKTVSLGSGRDRSIRKRLERKGDEDEEEQIDEWAMCVQQMSEQSSAEKDTIPINPSVAAAADIPLKKGNASEFIRDDKDFFRFTPVTQAAAVKERKTDEPPSVQIGLSDSEVKRRTGFPNEKTMLSYIIVACNGDINTIKQRQTSLTWYEEWFMLFEYQWNRSLTRLQDLTKTYGNVDRKEILRILDAKLDICYNARENWPMFASFEEDKELQNKKWASRYDGMRPVMWDMTNISAYAFSNADWQRLTYSSYYNENCFKSGVFCQPCGWMGVVDLWTGGVSDSDFNRRAGYLQEQQRFQENDLVETDGERRVIRFLNIYDKGYRAKMAAWQNGRQLVLQPDFKESDKRFNRNQTISSASIASDRGGNERVVNVSKRAGLISRGFRPNADPVRFNKVWTTWSFQANFMFDKVL